MSTKKQPLDKNNNNIIIRAGRFIMVLIAYGLRTRQRSIVRRLDANTAKPNTLNAKVNSTQCTHCIPSSVRSAPCPQRFGNFRKESLTQALTV
ncbi:hypothetical protein QTP88_007351 [Uroleucon formosanum]